MYVYWLKHKVVGAAGERLRHAAEVVRATDYENRHVWTSGVAKRADQIQSTAQIEMNQNSVRRLLVERRDCPGSGVYGP